MTRPVKLETRACKVIQRENIMAVCLVRVGLSAAHRVCAMILWILEDDLDGPGHGEAVPRGWDRRRSSLLANYADLQGNNARAGVQDDFVCERMTMRATRPTCEDRLLFTLWGE